MGKLVTLDFSVILPGENGFLPGKIDSLIEKSEKGVTSLPVPIRRAKLFDGKYYHLDGRHRLLLRKMQGLDNGEFYLGEDRDDFMTTEQFPFFSSHDLRENNRCIAARWGTVADNYQSLGVRDFNEFFDILVKNFPYMKDVPTFRQYVLDNPRTLRQHYPEINSP